MTGATRVVVVLTAILISIALGWAISELVLSGGPRTVADVARPTIGGSFSLVDQEGRTRTDAEFRGKVMMVYFGYSYCPDICPTGLSVMGQALDQLGLDGAKVAPILVTIDPERDTPPVLKEYVAQFGPEFVGLTGSPEQIALAARAYRVYYKKSEETAADPQNYLMDHSSIIYLMDQEGRYHGHFTHESAPADIAAALRELLKPAS